METGLLPWILAAAFAAAAVGFWIAFTRQRERARGLDRELAELGARPSVNEYRLERFDLLWFPTVTFLPDEKLVTKAGAGVPYCRSCLKPFAPESGGWRCTGCNQRRPDSVVDAAATDSIVREALKFFREKRPDYRLAPELEPYVR